MKSLDHKILGKKLSLKKAKSQIDSLIIDLEQQHYLHRKIQFLLDIRGYLKVNNISGSYVEFGSFKSEMQYAAFKILEETDCITSYVGLDSFSDNLEFSDEDKDHNIYEIPTDFNCDFETVDKFVKSNIGEKAVLIQGDFRTNKIKEEFKSAVNDISVAVFDCNFVSSTTAALELLDELVIPGCVLFFDDYLTNFNNGVPAMPDLIDTFFSKSRFELLDHGSYPPFGKSFIVIERGRQ